MDRRAQVRDQVMAALNQPNIFLFSRINYLRRKPGAWAVWGLARGPAIYVTHFKLRMRNLSWRR